MRREEADHRDQRVVHAVELETARERLVAYLPAAEAAGELVAGKQVT